jgi:hypothetical protein
MVWKIPKRFRFFFHETSINATGLSFQQYCYLAADDTNERSDLEEQAPNRRFFLLILMGF